MRYSCILLLLLAGCSSTYRTVNQNDRVGRGAAGFADVPVDSWHVNEEECSGTRCGGMFNGHPARFYYETLEAVSYGSRGDWVYGGRVEACGEVWYIAYERQALLPQRTRKTIRENADRCGYHGTARTEGEATGSSEVPQYITVPDSSEAP